MNTTLIPDVTLTFSPECCKEYTGMAFDGNYFFLTVPSELKICKFSLDFILCCLIDTCRPYTSISYDNKENCFWAWNEDSAKTLFKLDREMKEISRVGLCPQDGSCPRITAVSYHRQTNTFLAAFTNTVAEFKKNGQFIRTLQEADNIQFSSVLSVLSCYATVCASGGNQVIQFFTFQGRLVTSASLPAACRVIDIAFHTCPEPDRKAIILSILAAKPDHTISLPANAPQRVNINAAINVSANMNASLNVIAVVRAPAAITAADAKAAVNVRTAAPLSVIAAENVTADTAANAKTAAPPSAVCWNPLRSTRPPCPIFSTPKVKSFRRRSKSLTAYTIYSKLTVPSFKRLPESHSLNKPSMPSWKL